MSDGLVSTQIPSLMLAVNRSRWDCGTAIHQGLLHSVSPSSHLFALHLSKFSSCALSAAVLHVSTEECQLNGPREPCAHHEGQAGAAGSRCSTCAAWMTGPWQLFLSADRDSQALVTPIKPTCRIIQWRLIKQPPNLQMCTLGISDLRRML